MKKTNMIYGLIGLILLSGGCAYRGAVYSEYTQTALDIRAQQASSSPIKVNFGYDRGILAYVPKRNASSTNSYDGEATSVISWNHLRQNISPFGNSNSILEADAGFISGVAAIIASAPADADVVVLPVQGAIFDPIATLEANDRIKGAFKVKTSGSPGKRIAAAIETFTLNVEDEFSQSIQTSRLESWLGLDQVPPQINSTNSAALDKWMKKHGMNPDHQTMLIYGKSAEKARIRAIRELGIP